MIDCKVTLYQPGTETRYLLVHGLVDDPEDARTIGCQVGSLFLAWEGHGAYYFSEGTVPTYLAEKFRIQNFMLDAIALVQFVRTRLGIPLMLGPHVHDTMWCICPICKLPYQHKNAESRCYCYGVGYHETVLSDD